MRIAARRDDNEEDLVEYWRAKGYFWRYMPVGVGFDGVLVTPNAVYLVEIKNPERKWKMEKSEKDTMESCERINDAAYWIIQTMQDAELLV